MKNHRTIKEIEARIDIATNELDPTPKSHALRDETLKKEETNFIATQLNKHNKMKKSEIKNPKSEKPLTIVSKLRSTTRLLVKRRSTIKIMEPSLKLDYRKNFKTPTVTVTRKNSLENHSPVKIQDKVDTKATVTPNKIIIEEASIFL